MSPPSTTTALASVPSIDVLYDESSGPPQTACERVYGAPLRFPKAASPYVISDFVSTIDGVVSLGLHDGTDSAVLGGHSAADRFVMAMLRAAADVIVVGARTLADSVGHHWTPHALLPGAEADFAAYRLGLGHTTALAPLVIVTASGRLPEHVALRHPATKTFVLANEGAPRTSTAPRVEWLTVPDGGRFDGLVLRTVLAERGWNLVLCEGGPMLLGSLAGADAIDEMFVTIAPSTAGRDAEHPRPGMIEGFAAPPDSLRQQELVSARRADSHLLLRYRRRERMRSIASSSS
ncbi:MAG: dihydrofolate reductase family protein [Candidatus Dormibacteraeota bacterium]|nr:dihydrofolate reductase family protein [Candidatus Dormibacteraeota bacterium]